MASAVKSTAEQEEEAIKQWKSHLRRVKLKWSSQSCRIDSQVVALLSLSKQNREFFLSKLLSFLDKYFRRKRKASFMYKTVLRDFNSTFQTNIEQNSIGSVGGLLNKLTDNRLQSFFLSDFSQFLQVFITDKPLIIIDGKKKVKRFTNSASEICAELEHIQLYFSLKAIIGYTKGHWKTLVMPTENSDKTFEVDVRTSGIYIQKISGQDFIKRHKQKLFIYEFTGNFLQHKHFSFIQWQVDCYYRNLMMKVLLDIQNNQDASEENKKKLQQILLLNNTDLEQMSQDTSSKILTLFYPLFQQNESLWKILRNFFTSAFPTIHPVFRLTSDTR